MPELLIPLFLALTTAAGVGVAIWTLPAHKWSFSWRGVRVDVRNYLLRELILLDGVPQRGTRVAGDRVSWAEHAVDVAGARVRGGVGSVGLSMICEAAHGDETIFDTRSASILTTRAPAAPMPALPDEPRAAAVRAVAGRLAGSTDLEVVARAQELEETLVPILTSIAQAREAAAAHVTLGGEAELSSLVDGLEAQLEPLLAELRALHVAELAGPHGPTATDVVNQASPTRRLRATA